MFKINLLAIAAAVFVAIVVGLFIWENPGAAGSKLTPTEVDAYLATANRELNIPEPAKQEMLARIRAWAIQDDGRPAYMLNLMRYYPKVQPFPGGPPPSMSPAAANAYYESKAMPILHRLGGGSLLTGDSQGQDLVPYSTDGDNWSQMMLARYPSRRAFLELITDPSYPALLPYKLASVQLILAPFAGPEVRPSYTTIACVALLFLFLALGWARASMRLRALQRAG